MYYLDLHLALQNVVPSNAPSDVPSKAHSDISSKEPSFVPSDTFSDLPSNTPTLSLESSVSDRPTCGMTSDEPSESPSSSPSSNPSSNPSSWPSTSPSNSPSTSKIHLYCGTAGTNGDVAAPMWTVMTNDGENNPKVEGLLEFKDVEDMVCEGVHFNTIASLYQAIWKKSIYMNIHSEVYPGGVARG